jgi:N-acetylglucosamine kinase-like BadF-type ATPase
MGSLYLGVDGGGTSTEFVCIDDAGVEVARTHAGTTYHLEVGFDEVVDRLSGGIDRICGMLGVDTSKLAHVFFGLPAYGEDRSVDPRLDGACGRILGHARYGCGNDMVCGWAGSLGGEDGINIVAGTGSIGYGEHRGRAARSGGWGELFSDEGSGYWIAREGLAAFTRMSDGRISKGPLHAHFVKALALEHDLDLCQRVMGPKPMGRGELAAFSPLVAAAASEGDEAALDILQRGAAYLAEIAIALRQTLDFANEERVPLSWSGSILKEVEAVRAHFIAILDTTAGFLFVEPRHSPSYGAALYARMLWARGMDTA